MLWCFESLFANETRIVVLMMCLNCNFFWKMCYMIERHRSCFHYMRPFTRNRLYFYLILVYISAQVLYNILYSITFKISFSRLFLLNILVCTSALLLVTTLVFKYITRSLISVVSICSSVQLFLLRFLLFILKLI